MAPAGVIRRGLRPVDADGRIVRFEPTKVWPRVLGAARRPVVASSGARRRPVVGLRAPDACGSTIRPTPVWPPRRDGRGSYDITDDWTEAGDGDRAVEPGASATRTACSRECERGHGVLAGAGRVRAGRAERRPVVVVPNAVDVEHFTDAAAPAGGSPGGAGGGVRGHAARRPPRRRPGGRAGPAPGPTWPWCSSAPTPSPPQDRDRLDAVAQRPPPRGAALRPGAGLPAARRRGDRAPRGVGVHREPRPDQGLRVPGRGPAHGGHPGGRVPRISAHPVRVVGSRPVRRRGR